MTDIGQQVSPKKPSMAKTFGIVAALTVLSKFAGLARDVVVGGRYGTGVISDAYLNATQFTGTVFILLGGLGGPFHASTVAVLEHKKDDEDAGALVGQVLAITVLLLAVATIIVYVLGHLIIVPWLASQYKNKDGIPTQAVQDALRDSTLQQLDIMLPLIVIAGVIGVVYGVLNIFNKVAWPSISPAMASIAIIVALVLFNDPHSGVPLSVGTLIGAIAQLLVQLPSFFSTGFKYSIPFKPQPELKKYCMMLGPAIVATEIGQLVTFVDMSFSNNIGSGAWTAINMSNRLIQLPLGVLITAMVVPLLPRLTKAAKEERVDDLKEDLRKSLRVIWFMGLPLSAVLLALPTEIIKMLFERGQWTDYSTWITAAALILLVPSVFFYVARDLATRVFYAYQDSQTPFKIAIAAIFIKTALDFILVMVVAPLVAPALYASMGSQLPYELHGSTSAAAAQQATARSLCGVAAISLATTIMTVFNLGLLTSMMRRKIGLLGFRKLIAPVTIMLVASTVCYALTLGTFKAYEYALHTTSLSHIVENASKLMPSLRLPLLLGVGTASIVGMLGYLVVCLIAKLEEPHTVARRLPIIRRLVS